MHKNERKPVVHEYENEQEVVMKVKELELQGIHQDDIYVLTHEKHLTKKDCGWYKHKYDWSKRTRIGHKYYQLFLQKRGRAPKSNGRNGVVEGGS